MTTSSAKLDPAQYDLLLSQEQPSQRPDAPTTLATSVSFESPRFDALGGAQYAQTARIAGRINATSVSDEEHRALLSERQTLLDKKLEGTISREQSNRLEYVRWSLDRIEDAKHGQALDLLEGHVARYEHFLAEVETLAFDLQRAAKKRR